MKVGIVGVGLIGGSIGLALQERLGATVIGYDPAEAVSVEALRRRAIGVAGASAAESPAAAARTGRLNAALRCA